MAIPLLAPAIGFVGKLFGNIFGAKGKARRAARKAARKAKKGKKKGIFGGFLKNIFGKKRSKGQRIVDRSNDLLAKAAQKDATLRLALEKQAAKSGSATLQEFLDSRGTVSKPLPFGISGMLNKVGIRAPQQFQLPPDVIRAFDDTKARFALNEPEGAGAQPMDQKTLLIIGAAVVALFLIMRK